MTIGSCAPVFFFLHSFLQFLQMLDILFEFHLMKQTLFNLFKSFLNTPLVKDALRHHEGSSP